MVQQATHADIGFLLDKSKEFHETSIYKDVPFDPVTVRDNLEQLIDGGGVFFNEHGLIAGMLSPLVFNRNFSIAAELVWFCPDGDGQELKDAFEDWAFDNGAIGVSMSVLVNGYADKLGDLLIEKGYKPLEISFVKGLVN